MDKEENQLSNLELNELVQRVVAETENRLNKKLNAIFRYKKVQITLKIIIFTAISSLLFFRSGKYYDVYLWFIGVFLILIAISELLELEELKFQIDNKDKNQ